MPNETIKYCSFADDERPQFIFILLENNQTHVQYLKLVKVQGHEYVMETNPAGEKIPFKAPPIIRKAPFNIEELEKKNRELEILVRKKFINGEVHARKGDENFYCNVEFDY